MNSHDKKNCPCPMCKGMPKPEIKNFSAVSIKRRIARFKDKGITWTHQDGERTMFLVSGGVWVYEKRFRAQKWHYRGTVTEIFPEAFQFFNPKKKRKVKK